MSKKIIPIYRIEQFCGDATIQTIKVSSFREESCTISEFSEHHRHEYYEIIWLTKGNGIHSIDHTSYKYNGSVLFLLSPGQVHKLQQAEKAEGFVIKFHPTIFRDQRDIDDFIMSTTLFDNIEAHPVIKVTASAHTGLEDLFVKMDREFNADESDKEQILSAYLKIVMTYIQRLKRNQENRRQVMNDAGFSLFREYKFAIEKNFRQQHMVQFYATRLHTQVRTLNALAKKYTGKTAGQLIASRIVLEAKRSLHHDEDSIKEIAYKTGFDDPAYFTRFFKKHTGISPLEFKLQQTETMNLQSVG